MSIFQFILASNFKRPEPEILCDLVYFSNKYRLTPNVVKFGKASELDPRPDLDDDPNSYIKAVVDRKFDYRFNPNDTGFLYIRIPLGAMRTVDDFLIVPPAIPFKTYDILDQINQQLDLQLTENDLENIEYTTLDDNFIIRAKATSKVWIGFRTIQVAGGGKKNLLFPTRMLFGFANAQSVQADKKAQLLSIANQTNRTSWSQFTDFDFGNMQTGISGAGGRNTRIYIHAHREDYIDQWLYFTRIKPNQINDQFAGGVAPATIIPKDIFTIYGILDKINQTLNLHLTAEDIENEAFMPGLNEYTLKFKSTSLGWLPGTYVLKVDYLVTDGLRAVGDGGLRFAGDDVVRHYV